MMTTLNLIDAKKIVIVGALSMFSPADVSKVRHVRRANMSIGWAAMP